MRLYIDKPAQAQLKFPHALFPMDLARIGSFVYLTLLGNPPILLEASLLPPFLLAAELPTCRLRSHGQRRLHHGDALSTVHPLTC